MNANFQDFSISAKYLGNKQAAWGDNWNNHKITVKRSGASVSFDFWASIAHPEIDSEYDVLNAFYCFVSDAISGAMPFEEFCSELGYDTDSRKAYQTWNACQAAHRKLRKIYSGDIYELANELQEIAG